MYTKVYFLCLIEFLGKSGHVFFKRDNPNHFADDCAIDIIDIRMSIISMIALMSMYVYMC